jgi:hypothetical protein
MTTVTPDDEPVTGSVLDCAELVCDPRAGAADSSTELPDAPAVNEAEVDVVGLPISVAAAASGGLDTADWTWPGVWPAEVEDDHTTTV